MKTVNQSEVIKCIKENIIYRYGLSQTITADQETPFTEGKLLEFAFEYGFSILNSTPYYAQENDQAESTNKILKLNFHRMVDCNPRVWHELLSEILWAYKT